MNCLPSKCFTWNVKTCFLWKKKKWMSSATNFAWRFKVNIGYLFGLLTNTALADSILQHLIWICIIWSGLSVPLLIQYLNIFNANHNCSRWQFWYTYFFYFSEKISLDSFQRNYPAGTWRLYNVVSTSMQCYDVALTLRRHCIDITCLLFKSWHFKWIICLADDSHEMSISTFSEKI